MWKVFVRMSGMTLSYICQKAQMDRNARPVRMVRRLLSFMGAALLYIINIYHCGHSYYSGARRI